MRLINKKNQSSIINGKAGFSLVELMVAIGLLAVLAAIAIPNLSSWLPSYRLKSAARDLYSNMQKAKMAAIKSNSTVTLNFTASTGSPCLGGMYNFVDAGGNTIVSNSLANGICLSTPTGFPAGFSSAGLPSGVTGTIQLTHPNTTRIYTITQSMAGFCKLL